jgi:hypothetical protein
MRWVALVFLLLGPRAAFAAQSPAEHTYIAMKQDSDIFLGEGVAELKDFDGDKLKTRAAAKERALGDLAANVSVEVKSQSSEKLESKDGKVSEELKSQSSSQADLKLDYVKYVELDEFPGSGQVTVLASLDKEDYRRQLAGKAVKVYRPEFGFRISGVLGLPDTADLHLDQDHHPGGDPAGVGLDIVLQSFYFGYQIQFDQTGGTDQNPKSYTINALHLGYDWVPWAWRVQPFVPIQVQYSYWDMDPSFAQTIEASAGLGLRFWANDTVAFQVQAAWDQGLWGGAIYQSGGNSLTVNGHDAHVAMTGPQFGAGITWSGF